MRTTYIAKEADIVKKWYVIDAEGVTLGRLASEVASILRGKNKPQYAPNADMGDYVIIVNAEKVAVTSETFMEFSITSIRLSTAMPSGITCLPKHTVKNTIDITRKIHFITSFSLKYFKYSNTFGVMQFPYQNRTFLWK